MLQEVISLINQNKRLRLGLIIGVSVFILLILVTALWPRPSYPQYQLNRTGFNAQQNFGHLIGSKIYGYNGLAFFAVDTKNNNKLEVINQPGKLPLADKVYWADNSGALMSFSGSFSLTRVEESLSQQGLTLDEITRSYTWYVDFKDNSLHLVYPGAIHPNMAVYSSDDKGFYFSPEQPSLGNLAGADPDRPSSDVEYRIAVYFYNTETKQVSSISEETNALTTINLLECRIKNLKVCLIAHNEDEPSKQRLIGFDNEGKRAVLLETSGRLIPTNKEHLFVTVQAAADSEETSHDHGSGDREVVDFSPAPATLHNLNNGSRVDLGFNIGSQNIVTYVDGNNFYTLDDTVRTSKGLGGYYSGKIENQQADYLEYPLSLGEELYEGGLLGLNSYGSDSLILITAADNEQYLTSPLKVDKTIAMLNNNQAEAKIKSCVSKTAASYQYFQDFRQFKIFFSGEDNLVSKISRFNDCLINEAPQSFIGYTYYYGTQDPVNGRITSD